MSEDELLASIARKIILMDDWFDPDPSNDGSPRVLIDGLIETFTDEEAALMRSMRAAFKATWEPAP